MTICFDKELIQIPYLSHKIFKMRIYTLFLILIFTMSCKGQMKEKHKYTNALSKETSPYLLQHAHNPVNWHAWNQETLDLAKKENKLLLISIGYAACHWCHVMEHESFEDEAVAAIMNANFICIKVDREERPDVDQIYMDAVQALNGNGGWPLNAVALPNGKPFWGGTYFPKDKWSSVLTQIVRLWEDEPDKVKAYAQELNDKMIATNEIVKVPHTDTALFNKEQLKSINKYWTSFFDERLGGYNRAPKFPMPNNYHYLLRYAVQSDDTKLLEYINTTLTKMAYGGVNDQLGGGFARYSTDKKWHIPHFEKMLYDNAQLVSLYADAYLVTKNPLYKETVYQTLEFVAKELTDISGGFYASLDADSENASGEIVEGAYYYWSKMQLEEVLQKEYELFSLYYNINSYGMWEDQHYVLIRSESDVDFVKENDISIDELIKKKQNWRDLLLTSREKRMRPRLDNKILTSWNALMLKGYVDAYRVFGEPKFLQIAKKNATFLIKNLLREDGGLNRSYKPNSVQINAYLEDYTALIDALIALYEVSLEEEFLTKAKELNEYILLHFHDPKSGYFFFTSDKDEALITRKIDLLDNVIPSANAMMARNLFKLGHYFSNNSWRNRSKTMLQGVFEKAKQYPPSYAYWLQLAADTSGNYYEVAISGPDALTIVKEFNKIYIPNKLIVGSNEKSELPLLQHRFDKGQTNIYICVNNACQLPTTSITEALQQVDVKTLK